MTQGPDERDAIGAGYAAQIARDVTMLSSWARALDEDDLYRPPPDGEWTVMKNLVHVVEFLPYWAEQLHYVIAHAGEPFGRTHEDPDRIAAVEEHAKDGLEEVLDRLSGAAEAAQLALSQIPDDVWDRTGVHRRGEMTLREIAEFFLVDHLGDHIQQAREAHAALEATPAAKQS